MILIIKKIVQNRVFLHILFWTTSFYVLLHHFTISSQRSLVDYIFTALFHVSLVYVVYINMFLLIPKFLNRQNYWKYIINLIIQYFIFYGLHLFTFDYLADILFPGYYLIIFYDHIELLKYFAIYIGITSAFFLSRSWFELLESKKVLAEQEKEMVQNELKALKAQVNPHFLFNSLNSIYSLSLKKSDHTPEVILKLSSVLRYVIYESNEEKVLLSKEIEFLNHFIDLQKIRTSEPDMIKFDIIGDVNEFRIAPLIFITFIENAFKHGMKGDVKNQYVNINLDIKENSLSLLVENNMGKVDEVEDEKFKGLGMENVRRRLELLYPEKHTLEVRSNSETFKVHLTLQL